MLGYIRPAYGELRVREHELYRAAYCGLCRSMKKCTGCMSALTLNYDFVFLALIRSALCGERPKVRSGRCVAHPLKKKPYTVPSESFFYAAAASAVLSSGKVADDLCDERGFRRFASALLSPVAKGAVGRAEKSTVTGVAAGEVSLMEARVAEELRLLSSLEREGCGQVDTVADTFGRILSDVMSLGLRGEAKMIAAEMGKYTGRFIYIIDAADDAAEDLRRGRYNPFIAAYGEDAVEEREVSDWNGKRSRRGVLRPSVAESVLVAAGLDLARLEAAEGLIDYTAVPEVRGIIQNIIGMGMPGEMMRVLGLAYTREGRREDGENE